MGRSGAAGRQYAGSARPPPPISAGCETGSRGLRMGFRVVDGGGEALEPFEAFAVPFAGKAARAGDDPGDGGADTFWLGAVRALREVGGREAKGVAPEELIDAAAAEDRDAGLELEQFLVEAKRAFDDLLGLQVLRSHGGPAAEVGEADGGFLHEAGVVFAGDLAPGDAGGGELAPKDVARARVVVTGLGGVDGGIVADEDEAQAGAEVVREG